MLCNFINSQNQNIKRGYSGLVCDLAQRASQIKLVSRTEFQCTGTLV